MPPGPSRRPACGPSWPTPTRRPSPPTSTPATASTSSPWTRKPSWTSWRTRRPRGGRAMETVQNARALIRYVGEAAQIAAGKPILIDKYLEGLEAEADAVCDGEETLIPGVMQHVERAGVHSGDSMAVYPAIGLTDGEVETMVDYTQRIGAALNVRGLMNVQYVIMRNGGSSEVYVLEVNPRASRTIPFIAKVTGVPMVRLAIQVMLGKTLRQL